VLALFSDLLRLLRLTFRSRAQLAAENLFLRKQLACYVERKVRPKRADNASRIALVLVSRTVAWRALAGTILLRTLGLPAPLAVATLMVAVLSFYLRLHARPKPAMDR